MSQILLVEDSLDFQLLVRKTLSSRFDVTCVSSASEALEQVNRKEFDLILLDVVLPDADGFQVCARMRDHDKSREVPIIFLTGRGSVTDKVLGFSLGADDYISKPFEPLELRARVESKLNRAKKTAEEIVKKGDLRIHLSFQKASVIGENSEETDLGLTSIEFKLLYFFAKHEGHVLSRRQLLNVIWGENVYVLDRTIDKHICSLRQKLGDRSAYIRTVPGAGYRFSADKSR